MRTRKLPIPMVLVLVGGLLMSACATGPAFIVSEGPADGNALIYLYRPKAMGAGAKTPTVRINETHTVELYNGGYAEIEVPPGRNRLWIAKASIFETDWSGEVLVDAEPGKSYFVRFQPRLEHYGGIYTVIFTTDFYQVDRSRGLEELFGTRRVNVTAVKAD